MRLLEIAGKRNDLKLSKQEMHQFKSKSGFMKC